MSEDKQNLEISYILNECCTKLENLKFQVTYRMYQDGRVLSL